MYRWLRLHFLSYLPCIDGASRRERATVSESIANPIVNSPYDPPTKYFELGKQGPTGVILDGRRPSESFIPIPASRKGKRPGAGVQQSIDFDLTGERREKNTLINDLRPLGRTLAHSRLRRRNAGQPKVDAALG